MISVIFSECDCYKESISKCNQISGTCICNPGWTGEKCESKFLIIFSFQNVIVIKKASQNVIKLVEPAYVILDGQEKSVKVSF